MEEIIPIVCKLFQNTKEDGTLLNSFYNSSINLILNPGKDNVRKLQTNIPHEHKHKKILNKILTN